MIFPFCSVTVSLHSDQVQVQFFEDIGYNYERAGGSQIPAPGRGWIFGLTEYQVRIVSSS
jgi:hypothetical protein